MKEFLFCLQLILSQETYYIEGERISTPIKGVFVLTSEMAYLKVDTITNEYPVKTIREYSDHYIALVETKDGYGTFRITKNQVKMEQRVEFSGRSHLVKVTYTVKLSNL